METQTVLLLGASQLIYSESGAANSVAMLLQSRLGALLPDSGWRCEVRSLMYGRRMPEMAMRHIEEVRPAVVVVSLIPSPFTWSNPMARIRRRWPRFYPYARRIAERLKRASGGGHLTSPRGMLFRAPRQLLLWTIGGEPEVDVEDALAASLETLDAVATVEDAVVICGLSRYPLPADKGIAALWGGRVDRFKAGVAESCGRHHFAFYDRVEVAARDGHVIGYAPDRDYADLSTRTYEAGLIAGMVADALHTLSGSEVTSPLA